MNPYILSKEESERINILKLISIVLVVYIHAYATDVHFAAGSSSLNLPGWLLSLENLISQVIARCGVPIFFLISSVLLFRKPRSYIGTLKSKVRTLLVPYLLWNTFWIAVFVVLQSWRFTAPFFSGRNTLILQRSFAEWLELYGIGMQLPSPQDYPLWFMRDLMIVMLFFPVIGKIADTCPKILLFGSVSLLVAPVNFPLKDALLWFCLGACLVKLQIHITALDSIALWKLSLLYVPFAAVTLAAEYFLWDKLFIFVGILYWTRMSKWIFDRESIKKVFLWLSEWVFVIYAAHEMTLSSLKKVCMKLLPTEPVWLFLEYIGLPVLVMAGCVAVGVLFKKFAPKLYALSTGAR